MIGSSRGLRPSRAHPEAEGTDSPPHHPFSDSAEILRISGRGICKEAIFSPGGQAPAPKKSAPGATNQNLRFRLVGREAACLPFGQATFPPRRSPASIGSREGSHLLELSGAVLMEKLISDEAGCSFEDFGSRRHERGALRSPTSPRGRGARGLRPSRALPELFWRRYWFPTMQVVLLGTLFPTTRAWGAPLPYSRRGARGLRPSRALPGLFWRRYWFPTMQVVLWGTLFPTGQAILLMALFSTTRAWGALLPYTPSGDGAERAVTLSRSPGAVLVEIFVSDGAGCSLDGFVSDDASVGRSTPLHPLG